MEIHLSEKRTILYRTTLNENANEAKLCERSNVFSETRRCFGFDAVLVSCWMIPLGSLESTERFSRHDYNTKDAVRTYRRVAYMPTWQAKNGNYLKNVLLGRRLNLITKRRWASSMLPSYALLASRNPHLPFASQLPLLQGHRIQLFRFRQS